ncbi:MAG TPA: D-2-hydroxyacid dehydrogenase [Anaeromyxobacteraceae bacterium]|nr:D-2-hydroxyacid dehydrogenase [Anaeromyxobacteraceae bacterium]
MSGGLQRGTPRAARRRSPGRPVIAVALLATSGFALAGEGGGTADPAGWIADLGLHVDARPVRERAGWRPPKVILVGADAPERIAALRKVAPGVRFVEVPDRAPAPDVSDADAAIGICDPDVVARAAKLAWIQLLSAGAERCVRLPVVRERRPLVTNMQRVYGPAMAEHVFAMLLAFTRSLHPLRAAQERGAWLDRADLPRLDTLGGKTMLVVGLGGIGTEVARRASAFGMRVIATRASGRTGPEYVSYVGLPDELLPLASQADVVVNCTPLTPATTGLFDARFFARMKPTAFFINVGRGRSAVTADLVEALQRGRIAGAGLDVVDPEPLPPGHPLWKLPNAIVTPHLSAAAEMSSGLRWRVVEENLRRYLAGEPMLSVVDIERGY